MKAPNIAPLNALWQAVSVAGEIRDLARERRVYVFSTGPDTTFYLRAEHAEVRITRWSLARIEVRANLEAAFGWRIATDQDAAGVYVAAHRRRVLGRVSSAVFFVAVPQDTYLILRLDQGKIVLESVDGTLQIPPPSSGDKPLYLLPG